MPNDNSGGKSMNKNSKKLKVGFFAALTSIFTGTAGAQDASETADSAKDTSVLEEITTLGSRRAARSALDSAVPVDVISSQDIKRQGSTDPIDVLTAIIPSFNANREPISDAATLVRPINLRALPSDHTLVLVNGKRRHRGAVVGEFVSGVNRGAQGVDVNPLFGAAIKQVEVLRDGAAAQYGADAIAGVMNFSLEDDPNARKISVQLGESYEGDGRNYQVSGAFGLPVTDDGFAVLAFELKNADPTSRGVQDGEGTNSGAAALEAAGFPVANPVVVWGAPEVEDDYKLILNTGFNINETTELYGFGNYATRDVDGSFFYRNPTNRAGVFTNGGNVLFADATGDGCPTGALPTTSFADAQAFLAAAPANCFAFQSIFPGGFTPRFGGNVTDTSLTFGVRGEFANGLIYDISAGTGENDVQYAISNTINASLGAASPTDFELGSQIQSETIFNADFVYAVEAGLASELNIAFGLQYHDEEFEILAGQEESFIAGPFATQGFSVGANGFQGFSDDIAGTFSRSSESAYVDLEADITDRFLLSAAFRYENFSDFGSTSNGKIAARYRFSDSFSLRSAVSTGFRAPTLGQSNLQRASTGFQNGVLVEQLVIASTDPIAEFFGGGQLSPEDARNFSIGLTTSVAGFDITLDYFDIEVDDRVSLTSANIGDAERAQLVALGNPEAATISNVQFFVNDFDTKTTGLDLVANRSFEWANSSTNLTLALNHTDTEVTNRGATIGDGREREIEEAIPSIRATITLNHQVGNLNALIRTNYFGEAYESLFNDETLPVVTDGLFMVDAELAWQLNDSLNVAVGAKNLFDEFPDEWMTAGFTGRDGGFLGAIYPLNHPAGLGGGSYYLRLQADF
ncbi:TonB-dependent receptor plug domain-containing protein [Porticoccus sp. GXU_MW_L64]